MPKKYSVRICREVGAVVGPLPMTEIADVRDYLIPVTVPKSRVVAEAKNLYLKEFPNSEPKCLGVARRLRD